ncbi:MAG TPA: nucleotidyltransferase domain-containing protein [Candidatus Limnocylindrales bacterium]|nr:nucleotidyltransferase domain-containing protein [Candidatus Limnocylindrales bacterium]
MGDSHAMDVVGTKEAAAILGVRPSNFIRDWAMRPDFPRPVVSLDRRRLWERDAVSAYQRRVGRRRGARTASLTVSPAAARWLPVLKRRIVRVADPDRIILFGSQARGDATPASDLDLLVVVPDDRDRSALVPTIRVSLADIGVAKDIFITTPAQVERYGDVIGSLLEPALREGVTIYARS